jgi:putative membrane protein
VVTLNALLAAILSEVAGLGMSHDLLQHWEMVYSLVLKTSLAFLLVFRLNRCAMRFWEARGQWGAITHVTRNLVGGIIMYSRHSPQHRDMAIRWSSAFCVAAMHFIRSEHDYSFDELAGFLSPDQIKRMQDANHSALFAASMCRYHLRKAFKIDSYTPPQIAHAYAIQMMSLEQQVGKLVEQVSGMEKIRSTPLPIAYVSHLRTFLFTYLCFLPYVWVNDWGWTTVPLVAFTAFALFGIEGASSEVEIPFDRSRPNHLALDAYCMIILDSVQGLVVHEANMEMQEQQEDEAPEFMDCPADLNNDAMAEMEC